MSLSTQRETSPTDSVALASRIRRHVLRMTSKSGCAHIGSVFSMADILAVLYAGTLRVDAARPNWEGRDRFILSKGHAGAGMYAVLSECGFFPIGKLDTHYENGSDLSGHVSHKGVPGVEVSSGSLGHGLSIAAGMAYAGKLDGKTHRVVALLGDGECDEGANWEAMLFAAHHALDNLVAIVDYNNMQSLGTVAETLALEPFASKWRAFNWATAEIDGHNHPEMRDAFERLPLEPGRPTCFVAHTIKGKGVSFMENSVLWHYRAPRGAEFEAAMKELGGEE
jgi:transketolase